MCVIQEKVKIYTLGAWQKWIIDGKNNSQSKYKLVFVEMVHKSVSRSPCALDESGLQA